MSPRWHPAMRWGVLAAAIVSVPSAMLYLAGRRAFGAKAGKRYTYVFIGGPRDGETQSMTFAFPAGTVIEGRSRLPSRRTRDGVWLITDDFQQLPDGRQARIARFQSPVRG